MTRSERVITKILRKNFNENIKAASIAQGPDNQLKVFF